MCYSGKCKYEQYNGDCKLTSFPYPEDAACVIADKEIQEFEKKLLDKQQDMPEDFKEVIDDNFWEVI